MNVQVSVIQNRTVMLTVTGILTICSIHLQMPSKRKKNEARKAKKEARRESEK